MEGPLAQASALLATAAVVMVAAEVATRAREATLVTGLAVAEGYWAACQQLTT